jgi:hypothetical protein
LSSSSLTADPSARGTPVVALKLLWQSPALALAHLIIALARIDSGIDPV